MVRPPRQTTLPDHPARPPFPTTPADHTPGVPPLSPAAVPAILAVAAVLIAWGRWRHDLVALAALAAAVGGGAVPPAAAFSGFAEPAVAALVLLAVLGGAVRGSGVIEAAAGGLARVLNRPRARLAVLGAFGGLCSAVVGNGAAVPAILAAAGGRRPGRPGGEAGTALLPLAAVCGLGGLATAVGTVPNLLLGAVAGHAGVRGPTLTDFAGTGTTVALAALAVVAVAWRPRGRGPATASATIPGPDTSAADVAAAYTSAAYTSEVSVPAGSPLVGQTVWALEGRADGAVAVKAVVREEFRRLRPRPGLVIEDGDVLVLSCQPGVLEPLMARSGLQIVGAARDLDPERMGIMEAVVTPASALVGRAAALDGHRVSLLAVGRSGRQPNVRLNRVKVQPGDVLVLQGELASMPGLLAGLGCLPLAGRRLRLARRWQQVLPGLALLAALAVAAAGPVPLVPALLAATVLLVVAGVVTLDEAYAAVPWPAVVMAGALLPLAWAWGDGGAAAVARVLATGAASFGGVPDWALAGGVVAAALLLAPVVTGVAALMLVAPLAAALAARMGLRADGLLVAAAIGASFEVLPLPGREETAALLAPARARWREAGLLAPLLAATVVAAGAAAVPLVWPLR